MSHISYSELKEWTDCAWKHKLNYIDKIKQFKGNEHTCFGSALHTVCEVVVQDHDENKKSEGLEQLFEQEFVQNLQKVKQSSPDIEFSPELLTSMRSQGKHIIQFILPALKKYFGKFEMISIEEPLYQDIENDKIQKKFKGFIDLVVYSKKDGKVHLIDWKTCSWGWKPQKKSDKILAYQLVFYKHFYAQKYEVEPKDIDCHFVLLKRTAKPGKKAEFVRVTAAKKRTTDAMNLLLRALHNINKQNYVKNRNSCTDCKDRFGTCEFYQTEYCP